jgi:hypothetical protein
MKRIALLFAVFTLAVLGMAGTAQAYMRVDNRASHRGRAVE